MSLLQALKGKLPACVAPGVFTALFLAALVGDGHALAFALDEPAVARRMLELVNQARSQPRTCGERRFPATGPVKLNPVLIRAAQAHSEDMARNDFFGHTSQDGSAPHERVERAGYDYRSTAENIAAGQRSAEEAMAAWISSADHCANLMDAAYTEMGVALSSNRRSRMGAYWTQVFGAPRSMRGAKAKQPARF